jgi:hypothetical protein
MFGRVIIDEANHSIIKATFVVSLLPKYVLVLLWVISMFSRLILKKCVTTESRNLLNQLSS